MPGCRVVEVVSRRGLLVGTPANSNTPVFTTDEDNAIDEDDWN